jgi:hypothetical protein
VARDCKADWSESPSNMSDLESYPDSLAVELGDPWDETLDDIQLVVSFVRLSGEAAAEDFEITGYDDSRSIGILFKHLALRSADGWRIVVDKFEMTEYSRCTRLWMEAAKQCRDPNSKHYLTVTVVLAHAAASK